MRQALLFMAVAVALNVASVPKALAQCETDMECEMAYSLQCNASDSACMLVTIDFGVEVAR